MVGRGRYFGRQSLLRSVVDGLERGRSFAICGGPGTGRTSTLHQIIHTFQERWRRQPNATRVVPVLIDLAPVVAGGAAALPAVLWNDIVAAIRDPMVCGDCPPRDIPTTEPKGPKAWAQLAEGLAAVWDNLRGTSAWCEYGLLIDNADHLLGRRFEAALEPLAELLRSETAWAPKALLAGCGRVLREHLLDEEAELGFLRPLFLGALHPPEAEKLIRSGLPDADPELVESLLITSGKHPKILQRLLYELETQGPQIGVEGAVDAAAPDCLRLFDEIWAEFDLGRGVTYRGAYAAPEHALMQLLLDFAQGCDIKTAESELGIRPLKEYAEFLEYAGVGERSILSDVMQIKPQFDLWNIWYAERVMR